MTGAIVLGPARAGSQIVLRKEYLKKAGHRFRQGQPQWLFNQSQLFSSAPMAKGGAMAALSSPNGHFIKASPVWPLCKSNPIAILSKPAPMAILLSKSNGKFIKDSPKATSSRQPQWLFYQGKMPSHQSQLPLSKPMAILSKPAATAIYQGQPQWQLYDGCSGKGKPLGLAFGGPSRYGADLIEAGPDCQFIKASSNRKGQPLDLVLAGSTRYCAA